MLRLYGFEVCGPCVKARKLLGRLGIEYEYIDILSTKDRAAKADCLRRSPLGVPSVPMLVFDDGTAMWGWSDDMVGAIKKMAKEGKA